MSGPSDNAYVQQFKFGGRYWSTTDAPIAITYNESLADWKVVKWEDRLAMDLTVTHSILDPETGKMVGLGSHMPRLPFQKGTMTIYEIDPESPYTRVQLASFKVPRVPYEHALGLGGGYAVVCAHPFYMEMTKMMSGGMSDALVVDTNGNTTFYLVDLKTGEVEDFTAPPYVIYHFANVYQEKNGDVTFDQTAASCNVYNLFHMPTALSSDALDHFRDNCTNMLMRFTLHRSGSLKGTVTSTTLDKGWMEFPQFNQLWRGTRTCYLYLVEWYHGGSQEYSSMALVKFNLCQGTRAAEWAVPGHFPAEPKFIPRPGATNEDDGVLVSPVLIGSAQTSYLIVINANTMQPLQRFAIDQHVPATLHGFWDFADSYETGRSQIQVV
jgi:carotenoid cleavage dioxygenase-like enzyme